MDLVSAVFSVLCARRQDYIVCIARWLLGEFMYTCMSQPETAVQYLLTSYPGFWYLAKYIKSAIYTHSELTQVDDPIW